MLRRLFTTLSAVSLALCVATCALWVRSYAAADQVGRWASGSDPQRRWVVEACCGVFSTRGAVAVGSRSDRTIYNEYGYGPGLPPRVFDRSGWIADAPDWPFHLPDDAVGVLGFGYGARAGGPAYSHREQWSVVLPYWSLAALTAAPPAWLAWAAARRQRSSRRPARGLCPSCGYDLRATPERCPECGRVPATGE